MSKVKKSLSLFVIIAIPSFSRHHVLAQTDEDACFYYTERGELTRELPCRRCSVFRFDEAKEQGRGLRISVALKFTLTEEESSAIGLNDRNDPSAATWEYGSTYILRVTPSFLYVCGLGVTRAIDPYPTRARVVE